MYQKYISIFNYHYDYHDYSYDRTADTRNRSLIKPAVTARDG
jgi:hypothetical protein